MVFILHLPCFRRSRENISWCSSYDYVYLDDILVASINQADHDANLCAVFDRLRAAGFKLNMSKCTFDKSSVTYLAHCIDSEGLHPTEEKVRAIMDADTTRDVKALRCFSGTYHVLLQVPGKSFNCVGSIK